MINEVRFINLEAIGQSCYSLLIYLFIYLSYIRLE